MLRSLSLTAALTGVAFSLLALAATPAHGAPKTVTVECAKGRKVSDALKSQGDPLTIRIVGICVEDVQVRRDNVTFLGGNAEHDGIRAATTDDPFGAAVLVREARNIHFEHLQFAGGASAGLRVENARRNVSADHCLFHDNGRWGVVVIGSFVELTAARIRDNHTSGTGGGAAVAETGGLACELCLIADNPDRTDGTGVSVRNGGRAWLQETVVEGVQFGVVAADGSGASIFDSDLSAGSLALLAADHSSIEAATTAIEGGFHATTKSRLQIFDVVQTSTSTSNSVSRDSLFEAFTSAPGATSLAAELRLHLFSEGFNQGPTDFQQVICFSGSDLHCDGNETKSGSSCGLCP